MPRTIFSMPERVGTPAPVQSNCHELIGLKQSIPAHLP
jgi:hypothetical protein